MNKEIEKESYPEGWKHGMIHLNPKTEEIHTSGDHKVIEWIQNNLTPIIEIDINDEKTEVVNLQSGSVFKSEFGWFVKLMNPERPNLSDLMKFPVWAADIGNGHIEKLDPRKEVVFVGHCYGLIAAGFKYK